MAFGSVFVEASARLGWSLRTEHRPGSMVLRLNNTKANNHARRTEPLVLELMFSGQGVTVLADSSAGRPVEGDLPKHGAAILDYLADHGPTRQIDIARALDIHPTQVRRVLESVDGFTQTDDLWTIFTPPDHPPF
jgi:hypothetical protein